MFRWWQRRVRRTTLIGIGCTLFLVGLSLPMVGWIWPNSIALLIAGISFLLCVRRRLFIAVPAVVMCGLLLGFWQGSMTLVSLTPYKLNFGHKLVITGTLSQDTTYGSKGQLDMYIGNISSNGSHAPGVVRVTTFSPVQPRRGDSIQAQGKLMAGFGGYQAAIYFADVRIVEPSSSWLEQIRRSFTASILSSLPEPQASLGLGFLIGLKSQLPSELTKQLQRLSLTHIVVASGFNLTVLVRISRRLFAKRSAYQAMLATSLLMLGFLLVTGFSASMSRAVLVTSLSLAAWYYGRTVHPAILLLVAAALTAGFYPFYLWGDSGWWLSFLAFAGVLLGAPLVQRRLFGARQVSGFAQIIIETVCAQLATAPFLMLTFHSFSVLALPANLLIVPFIPLAMMLVLVSGLTGWLVPFIAPWAALPALWLLSYMTRTIEWLSHFWWAAMYLAISPTAMGILYGLLALLGGVLCRKVRFDYLTNPP